MKRAVDRCMCFLVLCLVVGIIGYSGFYMYQKGYRFSDLKREEVNVKEVQSFDDVEETTHESNQSESVLV